MKGNRYVVEEARPGDGILAGDHVHFGVEHNDGFDPYLVEHVWCGEYGFAVLEEGVVCWSDGRKSETTYLPYKPEEVIKIYWNETWITLKLDGSASVPMVYEDAKSALVEHDVEHRVVTMTMGNQRLTMSPEAADDLATQLDVHAERARGR